MTAATPRGVPLELHPPGDHVSDVIRSTGEFFEADILDTIAPRIAGGVVVDAGAHIGNHTAFLAAFGWVRRIHAFEPYPPSLHLLSRNVVDYPIVTVHPFALSDRYGMVPMVAWSHNLGHAMIDNAGGVNVEAMPLDALELVDLTLLKVDVEGHEPQVLAGARMTIERCRPAILIEDWPGRGFDLPSYRVVASWPDHQTYLYEHAG